MSDNKKLFWIIVSFLAAYFIPLNEEVKKAILQGFYMLQEYAKDHVIFCLIPAFFIAGGITTFMNQQTVLKYLGGSAKKVVAYSFASVSGAILSVCSCTVLPIFKGIYRKGAGLGPAISFLYSGPAINVLAILLTAKVLGLKIGVARAIFAILFSVIIGLLMHLFFETNKKNIKTDNFIIDKDNTDLFKNSFFILLWIILLVFLNWNKDKTVDGGLWNFIYSIKYIISGLSLLGIVIVLFKWFKRDKILDWLEETRNFAVQIMPLLFTGVLIAGFLLGSPNSNGIVPMEWIKKLVGDNSILSNIISSVSGALMYFATLTEVPILQGLIGAGMNQGPALALLLSGPSVSLPSLLVIYTELGAKKTIVYALLIIIMSSIAGWFFGMIA